VKYIAYRRVGAIAETITEHAREFDSSMIYMGTRGMTALSRGQTPGPRQFGAEVGDHLLVVDDDLHELVG